jgi:hypothetical protein
MPARYIKNILFDITPYSKNGLSFLLTSGKEEGPNNKANGSQHDDNYQIDHLGTVKFYPV